MSENVKDGFTAEKCNFQCVPGYMVEQWHDGVVLCSQFIPEQHYKSFCDAVGICPHLVE
jgi:hypothetical protein